MIQFISYASIDRGAYDRCVRESPNFRIYALSWYLDAVSSKWDLLVLDGYRAVMPLPRRSKFGLSYVYTPAFVQQLGVFGGAEISEEDECRFYERAFSRFFLIDYFAHSSSRCKKGSRGERHNYLLELDRSHLELRGRFNTNRRRILKKGSADLRFDKSGDQELFLEMCKTTRKGFNPDMAALSGMEKLLRSGAVELRVWNVFHEEQWVGGLLWTKDERRVTYLFPIQNALGKELQVHTHVIDALIKEHEGSRLVLDLEGSMIPGVANFYRSFGAEPETYYYYKSRFYGLL